MTSAHMSNLRSNLYATLTFSNNLTVLQGVADIVGKELHTYKSDPDYTYASVQFQPLPRVFTDHSLEQGGNVLGLDRYHDNNISKSFALHVHTSWTVH